MLVICSDGDENNQILGVREFMEKFTPLPAKLVRLVNEEGKMVKEVHMSRKQRRKLGIRGKN